MLLFAAVGGLLELRSVDFFWHLAAGRWILRHGTVPRTDPFRFTSNEAPWVDHEWGFQLLLAIAERLGGLPTLVIGRAALVLAVAWLLLRAMRRWGVDPALRSLIVLVCLIGLRDRLLMRAELVTIGGVLALLLLLERYRRARDRRGRLVAAGALVAVTVLWANGHPGVLAAPILTAAFLAGAWIDQRRGAAPAVEAGLGGLDLVAIPALVAAAILVNPWGARLLLVPVEISSALAGLPATNPDWAPLWIRPRPWLFAAAAALAGATGIVIGRRRRVDLAFALPLLALVPLVVTSARHQNLWWIAAALFAGRLAAGRRDPGASGARSDGAQGRLAPAVAMAAVAALGWAVLLPPGVAGAPEHRPGFGIVDGLFPQGAIAAIERWDPGPLLNSEAFGGYLLWALHPPRRVFVDTRNEVDPDILRQLAAARASSAAWEALLERYSIDAALVRYERRLRRVETPDPAGGPPGLDLRASSALLYPPDRFALVYWDDVSLFFVARRPEREERLREAEYRYVQPEDWRQVLDRAARDPDFRRGLAAELARRLGEPPASARAQGLARALDQIGE